jgi:hypothetical protein
MTVRTRAPIRTIKIGAFVGTLLLVSCVTGSATEQRFIGQATMEKDGTIMLWLRAEAPNGSVGHGWIEYPPSDPMYRSVLEHVGGLRPGESKPVPPWD